MEPHFTEEETILYAPVKDDAVKKALEDHAEIKYLVATLDTSKTITQQLSALAEKVDEHVRYEERELFPHMEKVLNEEQLENIGKQIAALHDPSLKDDFADEFWIKKKEQQ